MRLSESRKRSLVKTAIFRVLILIASTVIAYLVTNNLEKTTMLSIVFNITASAMYYGYERLWNVISWGRESEREESQQSHKDKAEM